MSLTIEVKTKPHHRQRYDTAGDWLGNEKLRLYTVSEMGNPYYETLIVIHEIVEHVLCLKRGITAEQVDAFDMNYDGDDPGNDKDAPYYDEHQFSTLIEKLVCEELGLSWEEYNAAFDKLEYKGDNHVQFQK